MKRTFTAEANDGKHMTLGELRTLIHTLDAAGAADTTEVKVRISFGGGVKSIVLIEETPDPPPEPVLPVNPWN